jgi:glycosyltransferase involved in cell wall biosynthesis
MSLNQIDISIVIPVFNEEGNIYPLIESINNSIEQQTFNFEIILVDDGSTDDTWGKICHLAEEMKQLKGIKLSRNFGHQHALLAGLHLSSGNSVISMDGDLQHPPSLINEMYRLYISKGYDIVFTRRIDSESTGVFKRYSSKLFYKLFSFFTEVDIPEGSSDLRLMSRKALNAMLRMGDNDLFLRGAAKWVGFNNITIQYNAQNRFSGKSKYSLLKMLKFAMRAMLSFSTKPLLFSIWIGFVTSFLALVEIIYIIIQLLQGNTVPGWASTVGIISFLNGILFILLGIIGSYLASIHESVKIRPKFIISDLKNIINDETYFDKQI